jgi:geranylgeranyl pyrophosphate synthase
MLSEAVRHAIDAVRFSHAELLREQIEAGGLEDDLAALLCLRLAEAAGAKPEAALRPATSLALLSQMARLFLSLEARGGAASLSTAWGMPRALNAGDAFYALAQEALLAPDDEVTPAQRLRAVDVLNGASRRLAEALHGAPEGKQLEAGQQALCVAAASLAGIYADADEATSTKMKGFAESLLSPGNGGLEAGLAELTKALGAARGPATRKA